MAWNIRSLVEVSARVRGAFRQYLPGTDTALPNNLVTIFGKVLAALMHEAELRLAYLVKQMFITTATGSFLELYCSDVGIYRKQASAASGLVSGTGSPLTTYPAGIRLISGNVTYLSTTPATAAADGTLTLRCVRSEGRFREP